MSVLVFDIESIPHPNFRSIEYPLGKNAEHDTWTDEQCIDHYIKSHKRGMLPTNYCLPIVIGYVLANETTCEIEKIGSFDWKRHTLLQLVDGFWLLVAQGRYSPLVSFNGRGFDLPVMEKQAFDLGVNCSHWFNNSGKSYNDQRHRYNQYNLDLQDFFTNYGGGNQDGGQNCMAKSIGCPGKMGIDGGHVWEAYKADRLHDLVTYCQCDVFDAYWIYVRLRVIQGHLTREHEQRLRQEFKMGNASGRFAEYSAKLQIP